MIIHLHSYDLPRLEFFFFFFFWVAEQGRLATGCVLLCTWKDAANSALRWHSHSRDLGQSPGLEGGSWTFACVLQVK